MGKTFFLLLFDFDKPFLSLNLSVFINGYYYYTITRDLLI